MPSCVIPLKVTPVALALAALLASPAAQAQAPNAAWQRCAAIDRLDLGQHDVAQAVTGLTNDGSHVVGKGGMIHRMHTRRHPGAGRSFAGQRSHQGCMLGLGTDRRSVFTIERHVKNAGAELLRHFSL